jgi:DNA polymerase III sliding clamp (beta) subunit (PCNA family)
MTTNTPEFGFTIPRKLLAAVAEAAPVKPDVREHLNAVQINITNDPAAGKREIRLLASSGSMLVTTTFRPPEDEDNPFDLPLEHRVLIPIAVVRNVLKVYGKNILLSLDNATLCGFPYTPIDGRIPDIERYWPRGEPDNQFVPIDPFLMVQVAKIIKHGKGRKYCSSLAFGSGALMFRCDIDGVEVRGIVMGMNKSLLETIPKF